MRTTSRLIPIRLLMHRSNLLLMLLTLTCCAGLSSAPAAAQAPPSESSIVISKRALQQCAADAARVDGLESRIVACQRDLDQLDGVCTERARQLAVTTADARLWERRARELEAAEKARWSPWTLAALGAGGTALLILTGLIVAR